MKKQVRAVVRYGPWLHEVLNEKVTKNTARGSALRIPFAGVDVVKAKAMFCSMRWSR